MSAKTLNRRFFLLQAIMMLMDCITVAYISPILVSLGYSNLLIGQVMTLGTLATTLARPLWGYLNDRFSCARQVTLGGTAAGAACYFLLTWGGGQVWITALAVMGLYVTVVCMMNFIDSWALRLINSGLPLNYGATRAGGSLSYAFGAVIFSASPIVNISFSFIVHAISPKYRHKFRKSGNDIKISAKALIFQILVVYLQPAKMYCGG